MKYILPNGMPIIIQPFNRAPVVSLQIWCKVGSADEKQNQHGMAHMHEHMLFKSTTKRSTAEIASLIESAGGDINAWTAYDETVYYVSLPKEQLDLGCDILSDMITHAQFSRDDIIDEQEVICEEILRDNDSPGKKLSDMLFAQVYQSHPYGHPILGTLKSVKSFKQQDLLNFYHHHYTPQNCVFVMVGDFTIEEGIQCAEKWWGHWKPDIFRQTPRHHQDFSSHGKPDVQMETGSHEESHIAFAYPIKHYTHPDTPALDLLSIILGYGESSRLVQVIRDQQALVNDIYSYAFTPRQSGLFIITASLHHDNVKQTCNNLLAEIERLKTKRVSIAELDKARTILKSDAYRQWETAEGKARSLANFFIYTGNENYESIYQQALDAVTPEQIQRIANTYLNSDQLRVSMLLPQSSSLPDNADDWFHTPQNDQQITTQYFETDHYNIAQVALSNHGELLLLEDHSAPLISFWATFHGGIRSTPLPQIGIDNFLSNLLTKSTHNHSSSEVATLFDASAANVEAFSGRNSIGIQADFISHTAPFIIEQTLECLFTPALKPHEVNREKSLILEEIRTHSDSPGAIAFDNAIDLLFPEHSLGQPALGNEASISSCTGKDLQTRHQQLIVSQPGVFAIVGDFNSALIHDHLQATLSHYEKEETKPRQTTPEISPIKSNQRSKVVYLDKEQSHIIVGYRGPTINHHDRYAIDVISGILNGQAGRLFIDLREKQHLAYSVHFSIIAGLDPGVLYTYIGTAPEKTNTAILSILQHMNKLQQDLVPDHELEKAKQFITGNHAISIQRNSAKASSLALDTLYKCGHRQLFEYTHHIKSISSNDILNVAQKYFNPKQAVVSIVGTQKDIDLQFLYE